MIGAMVGNGMMCALGVKRYIMGAGGIPGMVNYISPEGDVSGVVLAALSILVAMVISFVLTIVLWKDKEEEQKVMNVKSSTIPSIDVNEAEVVSPLQGDVISLSAVKDPVFAGGAMGNGVGIIPTDGKVTAPVSRIVSTLFPTKHAIGLTLDSGIELLIHIGMNTVDLNGKFFEQHVQAGMHVTKGTKIVSFDKEAIEKAGYDVTVPVVVSNSNLFKSIETISNGHVDENIEVICVEIK